MAIITVDLNKEADRQLSPHFWTSEFKCPHCNIVVVDSVLINKIEVLREKLGNVPIKITSGYRCKEYNKWIGGYYKSRHIYGDAADLRPVDKNIIPYGFLIDTAVNIFPRVGAYKEKFIHVDLYDSKGSLYWVRTNNREYEYFTNPTDWIQVLRKQNLFTV